MDKLTEANSRLMEERAKKVSSTSSRVKLITPKDFEDKVCEKHGTVMKKNPSLFERDKCYYFCSECSEAHNEAERLEEAARVARIKKAEIDSLFRGCKIGKRFAGCNFGGYIPTCKEAEAVVERCRKYAVFFQSHLSTGAGLILSGKPGTGKNHLSAAICNEIMVCGNSTLHTTVMKMIRKIKATWSRVSEENEQKAILSFCKPDLLVIDEVGVQFGSDTEKLLLTEIINERYERMLPTIIISNLTVSELTVTLGERIIDRFRDGGSALVFGWDSYRKAKVVTK